MSSTHKDTERYQGATATEQAMVVGGPLDYLRYNYFLRLTMVKPEDAKEKAQSLPPIPVINNATAEARVRYYHI